MSVVRRCVCGREWFTDLGILRGLPVRACVSCGVLHQVVEKTEEELAAWYRDHFHREPVIHGRWTMREAYSHDREVAAARAAEYRKVVGPEPLAGPALDVGSGNGAWVEELRANWGAEESVGCELVNAAEPGEEPHAYCGPLQRVRFPSGRFRLVTWHDVLEHVVDPLADLQETRRILRPDGFLVVDLPDYYHERGAHHWRLTQHLWLLRKEELDALLERSGFQVIAAYDPIPGKTVRIASPRPRSDRQVKILVPPGIGDSYWSLVKLPGFLRDRGIEQPDVLIQDGDGRNRSRGFVERHPYLRCLGYVSLNFRHPAFQEAYMRDARNVFQDVGGCDWFVAFNGSLRWGRTLEECHPEYGCDWRPELFQSLEEWSYRLRCFVEHGPYVVAYFADGGMYREWLQKLPEDAIVRLLQEVERNLGVRVLMMGAAWDVRGAMERICRVGGFVNLLGKTSLDQLLGMLRGAEGVIGFPAGNTIVPTCWKIPTLLIWDRYFDQRFWKHAVAPDALGKWYEIASSTDHPDQILAQFVNLVRSRQEVAA